MRKSTSLFFKSFYEYVPLTEVADLPKGMRGIYALYREEGSSRNLMYVGMTAGGAKGRLDRHSGGKKTGLWSHCSVFEVWDNITEEQIAELEALFRHALRLDSTANGLNIQKGSGIFRNLKKETKARA